MPLPRTKRSDGRQRPRWVMVPTFMRTTQTPNIRDAMDLLSNPTLGASRSKKIQSLLELNDELNVSTRDRPARTGADARIEGSEANGELRLALRPYGRKNKLRFQHHRC